MLLASCTAAVPAGKNSAVPPTANVLALAGDKQPAGDKPAAAANQLATAAESPFHDESVPPKSGEPAAKPAAPPAGQTPPIAMPAKDTSPAPAGSPNAKPAAGDSAPPKPPNSPASPAKPTLLPAAAQLPAEPAPISLPTLTVPASGAGAEQAIAGVLQYATQHHPLLRVRQYEVEAARARIVTARLMPNPQLMIEAMDSSTAVPNPAALNPVVRTPELVTRLMFTLPIGPKRELRTAAAASGVCQAQLAMSRDTKLILTQATDATVEVLYLQELCALYGRLAELGNQVVAIQRQRFNIAAVPFRSVVLTELWGSRLELMRQNTATQLDQAKVRLARAVGATDGTPPVVTGQLAVEPIAFAPLAVMQARVLQVAPELAESRTAVEKSREELSLEQWKAVPDLTIGPRYRTDLSGVADDRWGARVQLDLPVFDRNQGRIAEGAAMLRTNCARQDLIEVTTISDATSLYLELQDVQARTEYYSAQVRPLMERTEKALREAFEDQLVTAYELTDLLESMARMQLSDLDLRHEHQRLRMRLELLLECRLSGVSAAMPPAPPSAPIPPPPSKPLP